MGAWTTDLGRPGTSLGSAHVAPTSGNNPMAVSGIAKTVVSVATRCEPWIDKPTPPPAEWLREGQGCLGRQTWRLGTDA